MAIKTKKTDHFICFLRPLTPSRETKIGQFQSSSPLSKTIQTSKKHGSIFPYPSSRFVEGSLRPPRLLRRPLGLPLGLYLALLGLQLLDLQLQHARVRLVFRASRRTTLPRGPAALAVVAAGRVAWGTVAAVLPLPLLEFFQLLSELDGLVLGLEGDVR